MNAKEGTARFVSIANAVREASQKSGKGVIFTPPSAARGKHLLCFFCSESLSLPNRNTRVQSGHWRGRAVWLVAVALSWPC